MQVHGRIWQQVVKCVKCEGKIEAIKKVLIDCGDWTEDGRVVKRETERRRGNRAGKRRERAGRRRERAGWRRERAGRRR